MIVEIALGIILAVVILSFWRLILAVGVLVGGLLMLLVVLGALLYWAINHTSDFIVILSFIAVVAAVGGLASYVSRKTILTLDEIIGVILVVSALTFVGFGVFEQYDRYGELSGELVYALPFLALLAIAGAVLTVRVRKRVAPKRSVEALNVPTASAPGCERSPHPQDRCLTRPLQATRMKPRAPERGRWASWHRCS